MSKLVTDVSVLEQEVQQAMSLIRQAGQQVAELVKVRQHFVGMAEQYSAMQGVTAEAQRDLGRARELLAHAQQALDTWLEAQEKRAQGLEARQGIWEKQQKVALEAEREGLGRLLVAQADELKKQLSALETQLKDDVTGRLDAQREATIRVQGQLGGVHGLLASRAAEAAALSEQLGRLRRQVTIAYLMVGLSLGLAVIGIVR